MGVKLKEFRGRIECARPPQDFA